MNNNIDEAKAILLKNLTIKNLPALPNDVNDTIIDAMLEFRFDGICEMQESIKNMVKGWVNADYKLSLKKIIE